MKLQKLTGLLMALSVAACGGDKTQSTSDAAPDHHRQNTIDRLASTLGVHYEVLHNKSDAPCTLPDGREYTDGPCYEGKITLQADQDIPSDGWAIYYSQVEPLFSFASDAFEIERLNGDLHQITPIAGFSGFNAGEEQVIFFIAQGQVLTEAKLLPNYYAAADGAEPKIIDSTKFSINPETGLTARPYIASLHDVEKHFRFGPGDATPLATAAFLFAANQGAQKAPPEIIDAAIIPTPASVTPGRTGERFDFTQGITIKHDNVARTDIDAPLSRLAMLGVKETPNGASVSIAINADSSKPSGAYSLAISKGAVGIIGADAAGAAYGLYSLASLITPGQPDIPALNVNDAPRYQFRGMHVDTARNFHSKDTILKLMDQMAAYKLNKLHLHLADDEGWRLEIPGLPELTDIGSKRCHDLQEDKCIMPSLGSGPVGDAPVNGYLSVAEYSEILKAASARHIQVIPSLDMPGHARAAVKSMEARYRKLASEGHEAEAREFLLTDPDDDTAYQSIQFYNDNTINPCMESSYAFIVKVIDEVSEIHARAGQPLTRYHIGADETGGAWKDSPICKAFLADNAYGVSSIDELGAYFIERVAAILDERGIETAGWSDGIGHTDKENMPAIVQSNIWSTISGAGSAIAHEQANKGFEVVLSPPDVLYFDFPHEADPKEGGYYWATRRTNTRKVFEFMPDNLPIHAEFWSNAREQFFETNDTLQINDNGAVTSSPLKGGARFAGIQGQIWSETVASQAVLEYQTFPRLIALAERAWRRADWEVPYNSAGAIYNRDTNIFTDDLRTARDSDWVRFASVLASKEFSKLDRAGIAYRIPTVGAKIENGVLDANIIFPGLDIEFREVGEDWRPFTPGTNVSGPVDIRAIGPDGIRKGRSLWVEP